MPLRGGEAANGRDAVHGVKLALADARGRAGALTVQAVYLDDTSGRGGHARWSSVAASENARRAVEDSTAIAYVGDFASGATRSSLPITNEAHMLQVSPASSAIDLVEPYLGAGNQVPSSVQPTGERTFGRVIPSDEAQATAGAGWAKRLGAHRIETESDGSTFGRNLVQAFRDAVPTSSLINRRAQLLYYGGKPQRAPSSLFDSFPRTIVESDALLDCPQCWNDFARPILATSAARAPSQLPPAGQRFVRAFRDRYGRPPGRYAAYGYEAMAVVLDSIRRAGGSGDSRDAVVSAFFGTRDRHSVLGTYSIDELGNTTLRRMTGYRVVGGRPRAIASLSAP